jgi:8-oxo-dGTP pyrophosphatase MutT (NUDIX family)
VKKAVALVFLHYDYNLFLLQLRDFNPDIVYPGHWGGFGGEIEKNETAIEASFREINEELGYVADHMHTFKKYINFDNLIINVFYTEVRVGIDSLQLTEGLEIGLFSREQVINMELHSQLFDKKFPVAEPLPIIFQEFITFVDSNGLV